MIILSQPLPLHNGNENRKKGWALRLINDVMLM
jgi:hypothetical protein